jgi:hypothetical protein
LEDKGKEEKRKKTKNKKKRKYKRINMSNIELREEIKTIC